MIYVRTLVLLLLQITTEMNALATRITFAPNGKKVGEEFLEAIAMDIVRDARTVFEVWQYIY